MRGAAAEQEFERAAVIRNRLSAVRHLMERQFAHADSVGTADVLGVALDGDSANVQVLQVRDGVLQDRQSFFLDAAGADDEDTVLVQFAYEFYSMALAIPPLVVVGRESGAAEALETLLGDRSGHRVEVRPAARGDKRKLAELAGRNARFALEQDRRRHEQARGRRREALADLQAKLDLPAPPARVEAYDISNLGETYAVASMVVFEGGAPAKGHYRTFTMRDEAGRDDVARIREAVRRRFSRLTAPGEDDASFAARPGLVVIDGVGQLSERSRACARRASRTSRWSASPSAARRSTARARPARCCCRRTRRRFACSSTSATRPTASRSATTAAGEGGG